MITNIYIPARLNSTRLPKKPLVDILGKPLVWHTYQAAIKCVDKKLANKVLVLTDSEIVVLECNNWNIPCINS